MPLCRDDAGLAGLQVKKACYTDVDGVAIDVAVKTLKAGSLEDEADALLAEAHLVAQFDHPNVVALLGQVSMDEPYMIVFEFAHNGSCYQCVDPHGDAAASPLSASLKPPTALSWPPALCWL